MQRLRVRDAHEADHGVMRHETVRVARLQGQLQFALQQVAGIVDLVAHLDVVLQRHALDRLGIRLALGLESGERGAAAGRPLEVRSQRHAILERAIHALAMERHHRMRGIAEQHRLAGDVPAVEVQRGEVAHRIGLVILAQVRDQRQRVREVTFEQRLRGIGIGHRLERGPGSGMRQEQGDREGALVVRQGDAHVMPARPDVQRVRFDSETAMRVRRDLQLLVAMVQPFGALAQRQHPRHLRAQGGACAIGADQRLEPMRDVVIVAAEMGDVVDEVDALQAMVEMQPRAVRLRDLQQHDVQLAAVDRPDHLGIVAAIALQAGRALQRMHEAAAHHHRLAHHRLVGAGLAQCMQAAFGQRQVDRAPAGIAFHARVATPFEHIHRPAAAGQQDRQQGAGQAAANDGDRPGFSAHRATPGWSARSAGRRHACCTAAPARCGSRPVRASRRGRRARQGSRTARGRVRGPR